MAASRRSRTTTSCSTSIMSKSDGRRLWPVRGGVGPSGAESDPAAGRKVKSTIPNWTPASNLPSVGIYLYDRPPQARPQRNTAQQPARRPRIAQGCSPLPNQRPRAKTAPAPLPRPTGPPAGKVPVTQTHRSRQAQSTGKSRPKIASSPRSPTSIHLAILPNGPFQIEDLRVLSPSPLGLLPLLATALTVSMLCPRRFAPRGRGWRRGQKVRWRKVATTRDVEGSRTIGKCSGSIATPRPPAGQVASVVSSSVGRTHCGRQAVRRDCLRHRRRHGRRNQLSTIQRHLIEAFAGAAVHVSDLNARLLLGEKVTISPPRKQ